MARSTAGYTVGQIITVPQGNGDILLRVVEVSGRLYATGARLDLPAGAIVTGVEVRDGFTNGFLRWHQDHDKLYIVAAPREEDILARDTDLVLIHIEGGSGGEVIIEAQSAVGEMIVFQVFLPVITRQ